ncbi:MAG: single-stranded-DNA-specific exonuclease RecJ [Parasporobacterium sp.]|nr:single-stranded-DNA-specific exonuclease RecJ [Parasporobacterium sp.]
MYAKKADFSAVSRQFRISPLLARILRNKDLIEEEEIRRYLYGNLQDLYDPFLMKGMHEGTELTARTIQSGGKIRIIGDYDTDGVCSAYILQTYLSAAGADVDVRLPDRIAEGYGMSPKMAEEAEADGISLIITCDNGISAFEAVAYAEIHHIPVIVTDHHEPSGSLPEASIIIDPKQEGCTYPFRELCGAGVAYKFVQALDRTLQDPGSAVQPQPSIQPQAQPESQPQMDALLDALLQYVGIATIADVVPLMDENRIFAAEGLKRLRSNPNKGLARLSEVRGLELSRVTSEMVGYIISPCINSAGRLETADLAYQLLKEEEDDKILELAVRLSQLNDRRKELTAKQEMEAISKLKSREIDGVLNEQILVVYLPQAHESVAGIIAGRLKEEYHRPAIVVTDSLNGLKGSGRSTDSYNMIRGLREKEELFLHCGGHAKACGFTLRSSGDGNETVKRLSLELNQMLPPGQVCSDRVVWIDIPLPFRYIKEEFVKELEMLEPFGCGNEKPVFAQKDVTVREAVILGRNRNLLKMMLEDSAGDQIPGIFLGSEQKVQAEYEKVNTASKISILYYPEINEFRGIRTPQVRIREIKI